MKLYKRRKLTRATRLNEPVVMQTIVDIGYSHVLAQRWLNIAYRINPDIWTVGEYIDKDDDYLLSITNFGTGCLLVTYDIRKMLDGYEVLPWAAS